MCSCSNNSTNNDCGCHSFEQECFSGGPFRAVNQNCTPQNTPQNTGSIIPFSSGTTPVALATLASGLVGLPWQIGFGSATIGATIAGETIDLTGIVNEAFSVPRNGSITAISAKFSTIISDLIEGTVTISARIYRAPANSVIFTATNAAVDLTPSFSGAVATGQTASAFANIVPIPVAQGDCLLMVYSLSGTGIEIAQILTGTASAGITIS